MNLKNIIQSKTGVAALSIAGTVALAGGGVGVAASNGTLDDIVAQLTGQVAQVEVKTDQLDDRVTVLESEPAPVVETPAPAPVVDNPAPVVQAPVVMNPEPEPAPVAEAPAPVVPKYQHTVPEIKAFLDSLAAQMPDKVTIQGDANSTVYRFQGRGFTNPVFCVTADKVTSLHNPDGTDLDKAWLDATNLQKDWKLN